MNWYKKIKAAEDFNLDYPLNPNDIPVEPARQEQNVQGPPTGVAPNRFSGYGTDVKTFVPFVTGYEGGLVRYILKQMKNSNLGDGTIPRIVTYEGKNGIVLDGCSSIEMKAFHEGIDQIKKMNVMSPSQIRPLEDLFNRMVSAWHGS